MPRPLLAPTLGSLLVLAAVVMPALAQFDQTEVSGAGTPFRLVKTGGVFEDFSSQGAVSYDIYRRMPGDGFRGLVPELAGNTWPGGDAAFAPGTPAPVPVGVPPVLEYDHNGGNAAVVGGFVYRGRHLPGYSGTYFYADWVAAQVRSFEYVAGAATNPLTWTAFSGPGRVERPDSFGEDADGELYIVERGGTILWISN